jgi:predicted nucleotidyltransferase
MRLTQEDAGIIRHQVGRVFGTDARVWLFGSRTDDNRRGGDIDLYVEYAPRVEDEFRRVLELDDELQMQLGEQRIDIVVWAPGKVRQPIHEVARASGVPL